MAIIPKVQMPSPYEFKTEADLIDRLKSAQTVNTAKDFFSQRSADLKHVVHSGVTGNTFRAFRKLPVQPSIAFREWAEYYLSNTASELSALTSGDEYARYVHTATIDLCNEWRRKTNSEMGYGRGAKLFNLVLKKFACFVGLSTTQRSNLIDLQHVPLDSYTIIGLRAICPKFCIPKGATMKFIETPEQYQMFQEAIAAIARKAGVPAIYYDVLAWDMGH